MDDDVAEGSDGGHGKEAGTGGRGRGARGGRGGGGGRGGRRGRGADDSSLRKQLFPDDEENAAEKKGSKASKKQPKAKASRKRARADAEEEEPCMDRDLGWDGDEDAQMAGSLKLPVTPEAVPGATPRVIRKGRSRCPTRLAKMLSPQARAMVGRTPNKKPKVAKPVVKLTPLWQGEDGELNEEWVDEATKKRIVFLLSGIESATFEDVKAHLLAHRSDFKKTQVSAYWTRSAVGLKLLSDPCRPQMCTVTFKKEFPNKWNHTMVAAYGVVLKLVSQIN